MCFCTSSSIPIPVSMILNSRTIGLFSTGSFGAISAVLNLRDSEDASKKKDLFSSLLVRRAGLGF